MPPQASSPVPTCQPSAVEHKRHSRSVGLEAEPNGGYRAVRLAWRGSAARRGQTVPVLVLSRTDVEALVDLDALRGALRPAMQDVSSGRASMPARIAAAVPSRGLLAAMPAYVPTGGVLMTKLVSLFPRNAGTSLPTHQAVVIVFDTESGEPLALLDGTSITTMRRSYAPSQGSSSFPDPSRRRQWPPAPRPARA